MIPHRVISLIGVGLLGISSARVHRESPLNFTPDGLPLSYDVKQFDRNELDESSVQWDYASSYSIQLNSANCVDSSFTPALANTTQVRVLFRTSEYKTIADKASTQNFYVALAINCTTSSHIMYPILPRDNFSLSEQFDTQKEFTRITVGDDMSCIDNGTIQSISLLNGLQQDDLIPFGKNVSDGERTLSPALTDCTYINNFKTVYMPDVLQAYNYISIDADNPDKPKNPTNPDDPENPTGEEPYENPDEDGNSTVTSTTPGNTDEGSKVEPYENPDDDDDSTVTSTTPGTTGSTDGTDGTDDTSTTTSKPDVDPEGEPNGDPNGNENLENPDN